MHAKIAVSATVLDRGNIAARQHKIDACQERTRPSPAFEKKSFRKTGGVWFVASNVRLAFCWCRCKNWSAGARPGSRKQKREGREGGQFSKHEQTCVPSPHPLPPLVYYFSEAHTFSLQLRPYAPSAFRGRPALIFK